MLLTTRFLSAATLALITGTVATAQPGDREAPLRGPQIRDAGQPDTGRPARPAQGDEAAKRPVEMPFQAYIAALRSLERGEDESLRLTPDQASEIRELNQAHRESMREFMAEHEETIRELRQIAMDPQALNRMRNQRNERPGAPDAADDGMNDGEDTAERPQQMRQRPQRAPGGERTREQVREQAGERDGMEPVEAAASEHSPEDRAAAREKLRALMLSAPQDKESKKSLFGILTQPQRERIEAAVQAQHNRVAPGARPDQPRMIRPGAPAGENTPARVRPDRGTDRPARPARD